MMEMFKAKEIVDFLRKKNKILYDEIKELDEEMDILKEKADLIVGRIRAYSGSQTRREYMQPHIFDACETAMYIRCMEVRKNIVEKMISISFNPHNEKTISIKKKYFAEARNHVFGKKIHYSKNPVVDELLKKKKANKESFGEGLLYSKKKKQGWQ